MFVVYQIGKYIIDNNPWHQVPIRLFLAVYWQIRKRLTQRICIKKLFNGQRVYLHPDSTSASCLVYAKYPDKQALQALRAIATEDTIFLDVGANIGFYSLLLKDRVKSVYAFEAHPVTIAMLRQNFSLNEIGLHHVIEKAVASKSGYVYFSDMKQGSPVNHLTLASEDAINVKAISLDDFVVQENFPKHQKFIVKLDVEGAEDQVIEGARNFLRDYDVRAIVFESLNPDKDQVIPSLIRFGYHIRPVMKNNFIAIKEV